jgi:ABC-type polysaccharide/polyol phosphate transport system ATPase subunit
MAVIELANVSKTFRIPSVRRDTVREHVLGVLEPRRFERLRVLDDVDLRVEPGEAVAIMGRNGCGKSTLLKILCGVYTPDTGKVTVRTAVTPILELGVGWNSELDAIDNICLIGAVMGLTLREIRERMDEMLAFAELERFANLKLKHYSSGMSARLAYAVAFSAVRGALVLDEILAVGDAGFKERCFERYRALRQEGHTVVMVSHDPATVTTYSDRAVLVDGGRIVFDGKPAAVVERYLSMLAPVSAAAPH